MGKRELSGARERCWRLGKDRRERCVDGLSMVVSVFGDDSDFGLKFYCVAQLVIDFKNVFNRRLGKMRKC